MGVKTKKRILTVLATLFMVILAVFTLSPFYFMFLSSLKPGTEMLRFGLSFKIDPGVSSFENYNALNTYQNGIYWDWYKSSLILVIQTLVGLILGSMVGYGLAMYDFKGKNIVITIVLLLMMVPFEILLLPLYQMLIKAKLINSYFGVILPYLVPPFMVFFFRQYCMSLPKEMMEAARMDGCSDFGIFLRIMVPNMIPAYGAMTILSCMNAWNNLLWPLIVLSNDRKFTIPIGMATTITPYGNAYDVLMPGAVMAVVPIVIIYLFAQKTFIAGLTSGAVKG